MNIPIFKQSPVISYNPIAGETARKESPYTRITVFSPTNGNCTEKILDKIEEAYAYRDLDAVSWINIDGINRKEVRNICNYFQVHQLVIDDILSVGQRAKMDEMNNMIFCLMPMLFFNKEFNTIEKEQVSLLLIKNVVLSFQDEVSRDAFDPVREKIRSGQSRLYNSGADALFNALLDALVDQYYMVIETFGLKMEEVEDLIMKSPNNKTLMRINYFRRELGSFRRTISPVREIINNLLKSDNSLIQKKTKNYFKDIYDHILQANETADSYRDLLMNLQELYMNQANLKMNEVMKVLAVVMALFAPPTLIAGIYGMNFTNMPELHTHNGYFITLGIMFFIFLGMILFFRKRGWF